MTYPYDLPISLPIANRMLIEERAPDEIEWLLERGYLQKNHLCIKHPAPQVYQLWQETHPNDDPDEIDARLIDTYPSLEVMVKRGIRFPLWRWIAEYDWLHMMAQQYHMPWLKKYLTVTCCDEQGVIAGCDGNYILVYIPGEEHLKRWHPTWEMIYYDGEGNILADYRKGRA